MEESRREHDAVTETEDVKEGEGREEFAIHSRVKVGDLKLKINKNSYNLINSKILIQIFFARFNKCINCGESSLFQAIQEDNA